MRCPYAYIGCFVEWNALENALVGVRSAPLSRTIDAPHVTFRYRPDAVDTALFGEEITLRLVGYGCDGYNEGVRVEVFTDSEPLRRMAQDIPVPHITLSVSEEGRPVDTWALDFAPIPPVTLRGVFGGYTFGKKCITAATQAK